MVAQMTVGVMERVSRPFLSKTAKTMNVGRRALDLAKRLKVSKWQDFSWSKTHGEIIPRRFTTWFGPTNKSKIKLGIAQALLGQGIKLPVWGKVKLELLSESRYVSMMGLYQHDFLFAGVKLDGKEIYFDKPVKLSIGVEGSEFEGTPRHFVPGQPN